MVEEKRKEEIKEVNKAENQQMWEVRIRLLLHIVE
jgi:hypothetical protein